MKRFTETDKWKDPDFIKMKPTEKLVWFYIMDNCNCAGFMKWDADICALFTGMKPEHVLGAFEGLVKGFIGAKDSPWIYVPEFMKAQKNLPLNPENNAHKQIIAVLEDMRPIFASIVKDLLGPKQGLQSPIGKGRVKVEVKVKDYTPEFEEWWKLYKRGNKKNAFDAWTKNGIEPDMVMDQTAAYIKYCKSVNRQMMDGQGWINQRYFESTWTHEAQGTNPALSKPSTLQDPMGPVTKFNI